MLPPMRVLLIEDDAATRLLLAEALAALGFDVDGLTNAEDALVLLGAGQVPDVLVTDIHLGPGLNGLDLAEMAKAKHPDVGIVFISAMQEEEQARRLEVRERYLRKPFTARDLARVIRGIDGPDAPARDPTA